MQRWKSIIAWFFGIIFLFIICLSKSSSTDIYGLVCKTTSISTNTILSVIDKPKKLAINIRAIRGIADRRFYVYDIWEADGTLKKEPKFDRILINTAQCKAYCLDGNRIVQELDISEIGPKQMPSPPFVQPDSIHYGQNDFWHVVYMYSHKNTTDHDDVPGWAGWGIIRFLNRDVGDHVHWGLEVENHRIGPTFHVEGGEEPSYTAGCLSFKTEDFRYLYNNYLWMRRVYFTYDNVTQILDTKDKVHLLVGGNPYSNVDKLGRIHDRAQDYFTMLKGIKQDLMAFGVNFTIDESLNIAKGIYDLADEKQNHIITKVVKTRAKLAQQGFIFLRHRRGEDVFRYEVQIGGSPIAVIRKFNRIDNNQGGNCYIIEHYDKITEMNGKPIKRISLSKSDHVYISAKPIW